MIRRFKLRNGLKVLYEHRKSDTVAIEISVSTGSNNETPQIAGMSHFLEHMVFEGTTTRTAKQISETIENLGGELNAATSNERTFFYIKLPKKDFEKGLEILSDMVTNPAFKPKSFDKEKKVILEEIKMVDDQPILYQWVLFEKTLFKRYPTKNPVYGNKKAVRAITRQQMINYYNKWYAPRNMTLCIVGDIPDLKAKAEKYLGNKRSKQVPKVSYPKEPKDTRPTIKRQKKDTNQAYMVLGNKTVPRSHKDSFTLDVIAAVFSKGLSGRINEEIRVKRGLAYSVGAAHESKKGYGFFVFHTNCAKKNLELCKKLILEEVKKLDNLGNTELKDAKNHLIGHALIEKENSQRRADELAFWENINDAKLADQYLAGIRKVTKKDIIRVRNKYLDENYTMVVISK